MNTTQDNLESDGEIKAFPTPKLDVLDKLYLRAYLSTHSHLEAHRITCPNLKNHFSSNPFSKKESIQFHISLALQSKAEALQITPELVMERLLLEATKEGYGSNQAARIQALGLLGKQLGMFVDKKQESAYTFNIVNYHSSPERTPLPSDQLVLEDSSPEELLPPNISLIDYQE